MPGRTRDGRSGGGGARCRAVGLIAVLVLALPAPVRAEDTGLQDGAGGLPLLGDTNVHLYAQEAYEAFPQDVTQAVAARHAELVAAGMDCARHLFDWKSLEPSPGTYDTTLVIRELDARLEAGIRHQFCNITVLDSFGVESLPPYIEDLLAAGTPWDDPRITEAFAQLLDAVVPLMLERGTYMLGLANEPGGYYEDAPGQAASFAGFVRAAVEHVHSLEPRLACTVVFAGPEDPARPYLLPLVDVATFNRYAYTEEAEPSCTFEGAPLSFGHAIPASGIGPLLDGLVAAAQGKLICIQEFGQSTGWNDSPQTLGPLAGLETQRRVIQALANGLQARSRHFRAVSIWTLNDHSRAGMQYLADALLAEGLPQCYADNLTEVFGPTGLVHSDATASPKPAFSAFKAAIARLASPARPPRHPAGRSRRITSRDGKPGRHEKGNRRFPEPFPATHPRCRTPFHSTWTATAPGAWILR